MDSHVETVLAAAREVAEMSPHDVYLGELRQAIAALDARRAEAGDRTCPECYEALAMGHDPECTGGPWLVSVTEGNDPELAWRLAREGGQDSRWERLSDARRAEPSRMTERAWRWRRKRNQSFGYWEDVRSGERVGPIPLDDSGRAAFVPAGERPEDVGENTE